MSNEFVDIWCPSFPRKTWGEIGKSYGQINSKNRITLQRQLKDIPKTEPSYISTYSFPEGHPSEDPKNIPKLDTLLIDFDFDLTLDNFSEEDWKTRLSKLLSRINIVCDNLIENESDKYWRASLSGFKGVHLYLDYETIDKGIGEPYQYVNGMESFTDHVIDSLIHTSGINDLRDYVDVTSGYDFSRLTRLPNTIHEKATKVFGENRYCVPVTIEELSKIGIREYVALTRTKRDYKNEFDRCENQKTSEIINRHIITSPKKQKENYTENINSIQLYYDYINNQVNDRIELEDVEFLLKRKPCIWQFHKRSDKYDYGNASHVMENQCIIAMKSIGTPIDVMKEFFEGPKYNETQTENRIKQILSRNYNEYDCQKITSQAQMFCLGNDCKIYQNDNNLQI